MSIVEVYFAEITTYKDLRIHIEGEFCEIKWLKMGTFSVFQLDDHLTPSKQLGPAADHPHSSPGHCDDGQPEDARLENPDQGLEAAPELPLLMATSSEVVAVDELESVPANK